MNLSGTAKVHNIHLFTEKWIKQANLDLTQICFTKKGSGGNMFIIKCYSYEIKKEFKKSNYITQILH